MRSNPYMAKVQLSLEDIHAAGSSIPKLGACAGVDVSEVPQRTLNPKWTNPCATPSSPSPRSYRNMGALGSISFINSGFPV